MQEKIPNTATNEILSLRDIARWQFPQLKTDSNGQPVPPPVLAGLPSLQRGAVWRPNQVELLWDSILRGFPIGSLVVSPILKRQKTRPGTHATDLPWGDAYTHHLLDGQQRANAIALGYLHPPFTSDTKKPAVPKTLLWLDLAPLELEPLSFKNVAGFKSSTRSYLLRVTTEAHPWGFKVSDEKEPQRLEHWQAQEAKTIFLKPQNNTQNRPLPHQGWPIEANAPIPLAWALEAAYQVSDSQTGISASESLERALWEAVCKRCKNHGLQGISEDSIQDNLRFTPWAPRAVRVLEHWLSTPTLPLQALYLARGLLRALQARIVALAIAPEALDAPYRPAENSSQEDEAPIANVEHLFQRLNGGGTDLSAEERAYSMIKAYWPGVEQTIASIKPRPPETQVALLGTRLGLDIAQQAEDKNALPTQPSVSSLRQLAITRADGSKKTENLLAQRQQIRTLFGLPPTESAHEPAIAPAPIQQAIEQWDRWFLYNPDENRTWGLPPVLRSRMASQAPEVYLFLLRLAHHAVTNASNTPKSSEETLKKLLGLATAVHWFGLEREKAVAWLWAIPPAQWLDGSALHGVLSQIRYSGQAPNPHSSPTIAHILRPQELADYIAPDTINPSHVADWRWWDSLVVKPAKAATGPNAEQKELDKAIHARWSEYEHFITILSRQDYRGTNALLLMYAQRKQMRYFFPDHDPQDADFWAAHNVPWDFDHLLQQNAFTNKKSGNDFIWVCQEWGNSIANLHLLPFEHNRSRQDSPLETILHDMEAAERAEFLQRIHLEPETENSAANRLSAFSMKSDAIRSHAANLPEAQQRVTNFVLASRERLLRLYGDWFETLHIGTLL